MFLQTGKVLGGANPVVAAAPFLETAKQMFQNIEMNIFVPKDPSLIKDSFKVQEVLEDDPDLLQRFTYHVSKKGQN